ncbi:MAG: glycoside hydrolase family 99-like domain-containing protein [Legionellales bacterium]
MNTHIYKISRWIWRQAPGSIEKKHEVKIKLFDYIKKYFNWTPPVAGGLFPHNFAPIICRPVPLLHAAPLQKKPVKLICFYLPQFHPIPENDAWWGEGFTEWTNVKPAQPQFVDHYQPHIPGELGYYDLRDTQVQHRQIELAKLYGIEGFCFYFYWFAGKRLLETPLKNYLEDRSLDLPFCLCWANENWSRRWDGSEDNILIAQQHSEEDDLSFIQYVSQYLRDSRYIHIDGKPLLLVYRPNLLPSAKNTVKLWREWCRTHGVGEIYLAYTQSFESVDPAEYGFDAAIEFPPNNSSPQIIREITPLGNDFAGTVYNWQSLSEASENYVMPRYTLWRGICPSWDNTPRRKNHSTVFLNSSPELYQAWLYNAIVDTHQRFSASDEQLIFVNAWNEWAEGAYLEPDERYGYAYLEATRLALVRYALTKNSLKIDIKNPIAIVIHAFYEDIFKNILDQIAKINLVSFKLYVTCPLEKEKDIFEQLTASGFTFELLALPNRGRDILPFLKILPLVLQNNHDLLIKVHTKKSLHRQDGELWLEDMISNLLTNKAISNAHEHFKQHPDTGILGPTIHTLLIWDYIGSNANQILYLAARMGIDQQTLQELNFVAGTMFVARPMALVPLLNLAWDMHDFEEEQGQIDGTLAHAIERAMGISAYAASLVVRTFSIKDKKVIYPFAEKTNL